MISPGIAYTKEMQCGSKRGKPTQRQMGAISPKVDKQLKERSNGICELRRQCNGTGAVQRAHITGRKQIKHITTVNDLLHVCVPCHIWLDQSVDGIRYKKTLVKDNHIPHIAMNGGEQG